MKSLIIIILLGIIVKGKGEKWYGEITGYDINDGKKYAGTRGITITHFYLCGNRDYWVHYKGLGWSQHKYTNCEPAGVGFYPIDAICISGNLEYRVRIKNGRWLNGITRCNTDSSDSDAFAGIIGQEIDAIAISGGDIYSVAEGDFSPNNEVCAGRVFKNIFGHHINFESEKQGIEYNLGDTKISIKLVTNVEFNFNEGDSDITFTIKKGEITQFKWNKKLNKNNEIELNMKSATGFTPLEFKTTIQSAFKNGMHNGYVKISFDYLKEEVIVEAISQINADRIIFAGGFNINISIDYHKKINFVRQLVNYPVLLPRDIIKEAKNPIFTLDRIFTMENIKTWATNGICIVTLCLIFYAFAQIDPTLPLVLVGTYLLE